MLREQYEGGEDGSGASFDFTVSRQGNMNMAQAVDYVIETSRTLTAEDFVNGVVPSGSIVFAPGESSKNLSINIKNDSLIEGPESFNIRLDDSGSTQILKDVVSFAILDDDPTNPLLEVETLQPISVAAGDNSNLSSISFGYFNPTAIFQISTLTKGGTVTFDGNQINQNEDLTFTQVVNALDKISFLGEEGQTTGNLEITVIDKNTNNSGLAKLEYDIRNKPIISSQENDEIEFTAGQPGKVQGLSVEDVDIPTQTLELKILSKGGKISFDKPDPSIDAVLTYLSMKGS